MGPLFQLIIIGVLYFIVAGIMGLALISIARIIMLLKRKRGISVNQLFWFPLKLAPYCFLAIIINVLVCQFIRDIDPPLTDYWTLPINDGLTMGAIDTPDKWYLWPSRDGGEAIISDIVLAGLNDEAFYGSTETGEYFIYLFKANQKSFNLSKDEFEMKVKGVQSVLPKLKHPSELYYDNRDFGDLMTLLLLLVYPLYRFYNVCNIFWIMLHKQKDKLVDTAT
ncbi:MAG: hypothetical protein WBC60_16760 [Cognaticolwellia sp.]